MGAVHGLPASDCGSGQGQGRRSEGTASHLLQVSRGHFGADNEGWVSALALFPCYFEVVSRGLEPQLLVVENYHSVHSKFFLPPTVGGQLPLAPAFYYMCANTRMLSVCKCIHVCTRTHIHTHTHTHLFQRGGREAECVGGSAQSREPLRLSRVSHEGIPNSSAAERPSGGVQTTGCYLPAVQQDGGMSSTVVCPVAAHTSTPLLHYVCQYIALPAVCMLHYTAVYIAQVLMPLYYNLTWEEGCKYCFSLFWQLVEQLYQTMTKQFCSELSVWTEFGHFLMRRGKLDVARRLLQRCLKALTLKQQRKSPAPSIPCTLTPYTSCGHRCGGDIQVCPVGVQVWGSWQRGYHV